MYVCMYVYTITGIISLTTIREITYANTNDEDVLVDDAARWNLLSSNQFPAVFLTM